MSEKLKFIVMVGVPGAGKSTLIEKLKVKYENTAVVCPDEYRKELGGTYSYFSQDKLIWKTLCPDAVVDLLSSDCNVIFDATNVGAKRRKSILKWVDGLDVEKQAVVVRVELDVAKRQNQLREADKVVPDFVIDNMFKSFVYPSKEEGFDKVIDGEKV